MSSSSSSLLPRLPPSHEPHQPTRPELAPPPSLLSTVWHHLSSPNSPAFFPLLALSLLTCLSGLFYLVREVLTQPYEESLVSFNVFVAWAGFILFMVSREKWRRRRKDGVRERREEEGAMGEEEGGKHGDEV